jgi:hypothetical protein
VSDAQSPDEFVSTLDPSAKACGNCRLWRAHSRNDQGAWVGGCRVMPGRGLFVPEAPVCSSFLPRSAAIPTALPEAKKRERAHRMQNIAPTVVRRGTDLGPATVAPAVPDVELGEDWDMTREELKAIIRETIGEASHVPLAPKWEGGTIVMKPHDAALQAKELPIDALFHKVVMVRDRLRVLEQKLNAHPKLSDAEKVEMQQYVTKCYGSLTSFNLLFRDREDGFVGEKSSE